MARNYLTFRDIAGKLHILRIECTRCVRKGRQRPRSLLATRPSRTGSPPVAKTIGIVAVAAFAAIAAGVVVATIAVT